MILNYCW